MFISKFSVKNWGKNQNQGELNQAHEWMKIEEAIKSLDGHRKTLVTLEANDDIHMAIGGGTHKFVVYATFDNETFHDLVDLSQSTLSETLVVGGQQSIYPAKQCVDLNTALKATKTFAEFGELEKSVS
jgi:hypothetical protein